VRTLGGTRYRLMGQESRKRMGHAVIVRGVPKPRLYPERAPQLLYKLQ